VSTSASTAKDVVTGVLSGEPPAQVIQEATRRALGIPGNGTAALPSAALPSATPPNRPATAEELRARGAELLRQSADVWFNGDTHPAYGRILDEIEPDEARILRLLALHGAQPSIDVRTSRPLGIGSELIESGLSMIGLEAGVRNLERTKADLNNLFRLGLVWFSREEVDDPSRYQVVEVQPDVVDAMKQAGRSPKIVRRSILLTPFGEDFCRTCLPLGAPGDGGLI
jgi:hypothetical protein